ncbi:MAG TPA: hypothetical protein VGG39_11110 [Polyangiaceae bacterium]|jgi:hypothetical protein
MGGPDLSIDDIVVIIAHPHGDIEVSLREWIARGPGPRPLLAPRAALHRVTRAPLPLTVVPLEYRNNSEARRLIRDGKIPNPWPQETPDD